MRFSTGGLRCLIGAAWIAAAKATTLMPIIHYIVLRYRGSDKTYRQIPRYLLHYH